MKNIILDSTDKGILNLLQRDAGLTYKEIAHQLKRSKTNIVDRINFLKKQGLIEKHVVLINTEKLASIFTALPLIQLKDHGQNILDNFKDEINLYDEVMECYHVTGEYDFMLKIVTSDMPSYNQFLKEKIASHPAVGKIQSFLVLSQSKRETAIHI